MFSMFYQAGMAAFNRKHYTHAVGLLLRAEREAKTDFGRGHANWYRRLAQAWEKQLYYV